MNQFTEMVRQIIQCELARNPVGITGVVDGSNAQPGQVGEFITGSSTISYDPATTTNTHVTPLVVPPGDWNIWAFINLGMATGPTSFVLDPLPTGMSNGMHTAIGAATGPGEWEWSIANGAMARGNFTVPTLLPFLLFVGSSVTGVAGNVSLTVEARRVR